MIRRVIIGLAILGVLALAALELTSDQRASGTGDPSVFTDAVEREVRLPVASELETEGGIRPVVTR